MFLQGAHHRRKFLGGMVAGVAATGTACVSPVRTSNPARGQVPAIGPVRQIVAGVLDVGYVRDGPRDGPTVMLLHGWPYDVHSYDEVLPRLVERGADVIVPYLRGHGTTRFVDSAEARSGQQASIGDDVIALMDALGVERAVLAGFDWGGRAACVAAALWPERCAGLVSVNGYLIQDIATAELPIAASMEAAFWYQFYFLTERGRAGLEKNRRDIAKLMWERNSPCWEFNDDTFARSAAAFDNPDYVDVVIHSYRHRLGHASGYPQYEVLERKLASRPVISVPAITLDGDCDGVVAATDGTGSAARFSGPRQHRIVRKAGHNLPQENPVAFADAVWELASKKS